MKTRSNTLALVLAFGLAPLVACDQQEGPVEEAGEAVEEAGEEIEDAAEDAADEIDDAVDETTDDDVAGG